MTIHYQGHGVTLHHGDCLDVLRTLPDASVDSVVTDPPYGLEFMGREWDSFAPQNTTAQRSNAGGFGAEEGKPWNKARSGTKGVRSTFRCRTCQGWSGTFSEARAKRQKACECETPDYDYAGAPAQTVAFGAWCQLWAAECLRVLKPGGHMLAFGGTRTWHRLACAVEDSGFEVRDSIAWLYGSGFPKSLDVSKAIDKSLAPRDPRDLTDEYRFTAWMRATGITSTQINAATASQMGGHYLTPSSQPAVPTGAMLDALRPLLPEVPEWVESLVVQREHEKAEARARQEAARFLDTLQLNNAPAVTTRAEAQAWQGWGTALKPAFEPIVVARKPLIGTVAANVLAHGTGALNIGACRIEGAKPDTTRGGHPEKHRVSDSHADAKNLGRLKPQGRILDDGKGRWPANVVLDEEMARRLDEQSGTLTSGANPTRRGTDKFREAYGDFKGQAECDPARGADAGGASRFFFVASHDKGDTSALTGKGGRIESCETASTAAESSSPPRQFGDSALGGAVTSEHPDTASQTGSPSTSATPSGSRPSGRPATPTTQNIDAESSPEQQPGERTPTASPASSVGPSAPTVTTTTTTSPSTSAGSAAPATSDTTSQWKALGDTDSAPFKYVAKADATERPRVNGTAHPTVKPLSLMRWLVRLVTPPGGTVLEPFAGSGTTVEACIIEGFQCIAIEREADYLPLIRQRIDRRRDPVEALRGQAADLGLFDLLGGEGA